MPIPPGCRGAKRFCASALVLSHLLWIALLSDPAHFVGVFYDETPGSRHCIEQSVSR